MLSDRSSSRTGAVSSQSRERGLTFRPHRRRIIIVSGGLIAIVCQALDWVFVTATL